MTKIPPKWRPVVLVALEPTGLWDHLQLGAGAPWPPADGAEREHASWDPALGVMPESRDTPAITPSDGVPLAAMAAKPRATRGVGEATETIQLHELGQSYAAGSTGAGLVLLYSPQYGDLAPAYPFSDGEIRIGRDAEAEVCIPSGSVSRQHARIAQQNGQWVLRDLGGRNGTVVNGALVREATLKHLDELRIGDAIFKFVASDAGGYASHRIDGEIVDLETGEARAPLAEGRIVGGFQMRRIAAGLRNIARSTLSVLLLGETGTGKEVFARQLHDWSGRTGPFKAVNCAAIPASLIEGELFGHKRGAFSGADRDRVGIIRAADGGTLFLDEIGDMPLEAQAKLLRVTQTKEVTPIGGTQAEPVDVRIVCATHRDLGALQQARAFRADLFARLNEYPVRLPPLRERKEDLYMLCMALAARHGRPNVEVTLPFMAGLLHYDFPYNVRELEALIKRWAAVSKTPLLDVAHFSDEIRDGLTRYGRAASEPDSAPAPSDAAPAPSWARARNVDSSPTMDTGPQIVLPPRSAPTEEELRAVLTEHRGNVAALSRLYRKDRVQVHRWMRRYGINPDDFR